MYCIAFNEVTISYFKVQKRVKTRSLQEWVGHFEPKFQGKGSSLRNIFGFYKTRHILLSNGANCTVLRAVVLTEYRRVTDGQTDRQTELLLLIQRLQCEHCARCKNERLTTYSALQSTAEG